VGSIPGARVIHTRSSLWYRQSRLKLHQHQAGKKEIPLLHSQVKENTHKSLIDNNLWKELWYFGQLLEENQKVMLGVKVM
jgi:hypothetical protein